MLDANGNRIIQVFYCPVCEKNKHYKDMGWILGKCKKCGSNIHYTFEKVEQNERSKI